MLPKAVGGPIQDYKAPQLFEMGLQHDGRWAEYRVRVKEIYLELGHGVPGSANKARFMARKEFGYVDRTEELRKARERYVEAQKSDLREQNRLAQQRSRARKKQRELDEKLDKLPFSGDPKAELEWVASHQAMRREPLPGDNDRIIIVAEDIDDRCPSQASVNQLVHWCNNRTDFHKQYISEQKKEINKKEQEDEKKGGKGEVVDDMGNLDSLLEQAGGRKAA